MNEQTNNDASGSSVLGALLIFGLPLLLAYCAFSGVSAPSRVVEACKSEAVRSGYGRCTAVDGRENNHGVYQIELDCTGGKALCQGRDRFRITDWSNMGEYLMRR